MDTIQRRREKPERTGLLFLCFLFLFLLFLLLLLPLCLRQVARCRLVEALIGFLEERHHVV